MVKARAGEIDGCLSAEKRDTALGSQKKLLARTKMEMMFFWTAMLLAKLIFFRSAQA